MIKMDAGEDDAGFRFDSLMLVSASRNYPAYDGFRLDALRLPESDLNHLYTPVSGSPLPMRTRITFFSVNVEAENPSETGDSTPWMSLSANCRPGKAKGRSVTAGQ